MPLKEIEVTTKRKSSFADDLIEGLQEAAAWKRGEIELEAVTINPMPPERIKAIRKKVARSADE